jgi:hypothetical protein
MIARVLGFSGIISELSGNSDASRDLQTNGLDVVGEMCELFSQVDSTGEGVVNWKSFSEFLIDRGAVASGKDVAFSDQFSIRTKFGERSSKTPYEVMSQRIAFQLLLNIFIPPPTSNERWNA